jgi:glycosyltransferase involved in cell wall biosynthesis
MRKIVLFRISSKGYPKVKVEGINKYDSLNNLMEIFKDWEVICVADNCDEALVSRLKSEYHFSEFIETKLGNPGSFWKLYEIALDIARDDDIFYFAEDDYLHLPDASPAILEGLQYFDYVTLYDHPDKYKLSRVPLNPYAKANKFSESSEVVEGLTQWWRTSNSTTMTLAMTGKVLREDADIWSITKTAKKDLDFDNFCVITKQNLLLKSRFFKQIPRRIKFWLRPKRYLGICIPGLSLHLEQAYLRKRDVIRFNMPCQKR